MRLSDILKKSSQKPGVQSPSVETSTPKPARAEPEAFAAPQPAQKQQASIIAEEAYSKTISEIKLIVSSLEKNTSYSSPVESVPLLVDLIINDNVEILMLADRATPDIFVYGHCANLCILSLFLGRGFNYSREKLLALGLCAFFNDIGLAKIQAGTKKTPESENAALKQQAHYTQDVIKNYPQLTEDIKTLILEVMVNKQKHQDLAAYPESIKGSDIHDFARIIAVANVYETLTHPRPGRDRILPHEALKTMISSANHEFDSEIIRLFLERISLYPPGSYVRLNSEEIGKVVGLNTGLPTRPKIRIIIDSSNQRVTVPKIIDLAASPMIFIKDAVDETRLTLPDKKLALELKAVRWWVKGL